MTILQEVLKVFPTLLLLLGGCCGLIPATKDACQGARWLVSQAPVWPPQVLRTGCRSPQGRDVADIPSAGAGAAHRPRHVGPSPCHEPGLPGSVTDQPRAPFRKELGEFPGGPLLELNTFTARKRLCVTGGDGLVQPEAKGAQSHQEPEEA